MNIIGMTYCGSFNRICLEFLAHHLLLLIDALFHLSFERRDTLKEMESLLSSDF